MDPVPSCTAGRTPPPGPVTGGAPIPTNRPREHPYQAACSFPGSLPYLISGAESSTICRCGDMVRTDHLTVPVHRYSETVTDVHGPVVREVCNEALVRQA